MPSRRHPSPGPALALLGAAALAPAASATWSILIVDTRTGEIAVGSATCVTGIDLREETPVIVTGVGAATAQSFVDQTGVNRVFLRDRLLEGLSPGEVLDALEQFDGGHETRQYGIVDAQGRAATFSGSAASEWKGGLVGRIERGRPGPPDDLVYAVQGNILTGEPVVSMAVRAIEQTPGDLAAKLMASMEAAAAWGGDGRCSCPSGAPTGCGSPPPEPFKSAHVGYMLISRPGDADACASIYPIGSTPAAVGALDLDGQGGLDAAVAPSSGSNLALFTSATAPGDSFATMDGPVLVPVGVSQIRSIAAGDVTGDGVVDLVVSSLSPAQITVLTGSAAPGGVTFTPGQTIATGASPLGVVVADLDGRFALDVAFTSLVGEEVGVALADGLGQLSAPALVAAPGRPRGLAAGDLDGDGDADLAVALTTGDAVLELINDGDGGFTAGASLATPDEPLTVRAALLDADDRADLVVATGAGRALAVFASASGAHERTDLTLRRGTGVDASVGDIDGDGLTDVIGVGASGYAEGFLNDGAGGWEAEPEVKLGERSPIAAQLVDLAGDGTADLLSGGQTRNALIVVANASGSIPGAPGCAAGSYFMELNTGRQGQNKPDPVLTLRGQYDEWAADRVGRPDGAASLVSGRLAVVEGETSRVRVAVRDRASRPALTAITLDAVCANPDAAEVVGVDALGPGEFDVLVRGGVPGEAGEIVITADDGSGPVRLLPAFVVRAVGSLADLDGDGAPTFDDVDLFIAWYLAGDPRADLDGDGAVDLEDVGRFVRAFTGG